MMPGSPSKMAPSPRCESCGRVTANVGKLPRIGLRPLIYVYKCNACHQIMSIEPELQEQRAPLSLG